MTRRIITTKKAGKNYLFMYFWNTMSKGLNILIIHILNSHIECYEQLILLMRPWSLIEI